MINKFYKNMFELPEEHQDVFQMMVKTTDKTHERDVLERLVNLS